MALVSRSWQLSRFGTILLPESARVSTLCLLRVEVLGTRKEGAFSFLRVPPQSVFGYICTRDEDGFVSREIPIRFGRQRELLWSYPETAQAASLCLATNSLYEEILLELSKKPNIPPLPPTPPPVGPLVDNIPRLVLHGISSVSIAMKQPDADFIAELVWLDSVVNPCQPQAEEPPIPDSNPEPVLPGPGGSNGDAPPGGVLPPSISGQEPSAGTSLVPAGFEPGDQYSPGGVFGFQYNLPGNYIVSLNTTVSPAICSLSPPFAIAFLDGDLFFENITQITTSGETTCDPNYTATLGGVLLRFSGPPGAATIVPLSAAPPAGYGVGYPQ